MRDPNEKNALLNEEVVVLAPEAPPISFKKKVLCLAAPVLAVAGGFAFMAYWLTRTTNDLTSPSTSTTINPGVGDAADLAICELAAHSALTVGVQLADDFYAITSDQALSICLAAMVPVLDDCMSYLTITCTQAFSQQEGHSLIKGFLFKNSSALEISGAHEENSIERSPSRLI